MEHTESTDPIADLLDSFLAEQVAHNERLFLDCREGTRIATITSADRRSIVADKRRRRMLSDQNNNGDWPPVPHTCTKNFWLKMPSISDHHLHIPDSGPDRRGIDTTRSRVQWPDIF
jgi:hypothetical protein